MWRRREPRQEPIKYKTYCRARKPPQNKKLPLPPGRIDAQEVYDPPAMETDTKITR
jgi:hypothetical protein